MSTHMWVQLQYTPIEIEAKENGELIITATEAAEEISKEEAMHGCWFCNTPLNIDSYRTECVPEDALKN